MVSGKKYEYDMNFVMCQATLIAWWNLTQEVLL